MRSTMCVLVALSSVALVSGADVADSKKPERTHAEVAKPDPSPGLTYIGLVRRLTDLERLSSLPSPGEKCAQWSSYDRASRYDQTTGKYVDWGANADANGIIRQEGDRAVLAETEISLGSGRHSLALVMLSADLLRALPQAQVGYFVVDDSYMGVTPG